MGASVAILGIAVIALLDVGLNITVTAGGSPAATHTGVPVSVVSVITFLVSLWHPIPTNRGHDGHVHL